MPVFMKYEGVDGSHADSFDFSQLPTEPTEPLDSSASRHTGGVNVVLCDGSVRLHTDTGHSNPSSYQIISAGKDAAKDDGLLLPVVQDDGLLLPAVQTDYGLLLPY